MNRDDKRRLISQLGAHASWARTDDRTARTEPARRAAFARFEKQVDPNGTLTPTERARRAEHAQQAHMLKMAIASAKSRAARSKTPK